MGILTTRAVAAAQRDAHDMIGKVTAIVRREIAHWAGQNMQGGKWNGPSVTLAQPSTVPLPLVPAVGVVQPDGTTIEETVSGVISAAAAGSGFGGGGSLQAGANDVTISSGNASGTTTVTFSIPYPAGTVPVVVATDPDAGYTGYVDQSTVTNTGFTLGMATNGGGTVGSDTAKNVGWHAALQQLPGGPGGGGGSGSVPVITAPTAGSTGTSLAPIVAYTAVTGAITYQVQASTLPTFATTEFDNFEGGTSFTSPTLPTDTPIYLRARVVGPSYSAWGPTSSFTTGAGNNALQFQGNADSVVALASDVDFGTGDFSVGGWAQPTGIGSPSGALWWSGSATFGPAGSNGYVCIAADIAGAGVGANISDGTTGSDPNGAADPLAGPPALVVLTRSGGTMLLYVDGGVAGSFFGGPTGSVQNTSGPLGAGFGQGYLNLGGGGNSPIYLNALLWRWAAWKGTALSGTDIAAWSTAGPLAAPPAGATNMWPMDEGSGDTIHDSVGGNDGTTAGTATWGTHS